MKQYWCENSEKFLRKWPQREISPYYRQMAPKLDLWGTYFTHIVHITKRSSKEHIKLDWCESREFFLTNYSKTLILTHLETQNGPKIWASIRHIFYTPTKVSPMSLWIKFRVNPEETFQENRRKPINLLILVPYGPKRARKFGPQGPLFTHMKEPTRCM